MGTPDRLRSGFRQPEMPDFACVDQVFHRTGDLLDGDVRIDPVLIEQVDAVGPESLERGLGDLSDVVRAAVEPPLLARRGVNIEAELRGDHYLVTAGRQRFSHELLIRERAVDFRRVEKSDAT